MWPEGFFLIPWATNPPAYCQVVVHSVHNSIRVVALATVNRVLLPLDKVYPTIGYTKAGECGLRTKQTQKMKNESGECRPLFEEHHANLPWHRQHCCLIPYRPP